MSTQTLFNSLQHSHLGATLGQANHLYGALAQLFHITGLILVLGSILLVNLRLLGAGLYRQPVAELVRSTNPLIWLGLVFLAGSGLFLFIPSAGLYYPNPAFWLKFSLLGLALLIQFTLYRKVTAAAAPGRLLSTVTALLSLTLWFGVGLAGRAIGFL